MKKIFFILTVILSAGSCDYKEYPEEQEWKEEFIESQEEMEKEKRKDPRHFDKEMEMEQDQREVEIENMQG